MFDASVKIQIYRVICVVDMLMLFRRSWLWHKFNTAQTKFIAAGSPDGKFPKFLRRERYDLLEAKKRAVVSTRPDASAQTSTPGPLSIASA
jgi:hypothetical protein